MESANIHKQESIRKMRGPIAPGAPKLVQLARTLALFLLAFFSFQLVAFAQLSVAITVKNPDPYTGNQSWFIYTKNPGEVISDIATIKNYGDKPDSVYVGAVDGTTNSGGAFVLNFDAEQQNNIGSWLEIKKQEITIKPGERVDIPFKIHIPANVQPGQYMGGIVVENLDAHQQRTTVKTSEGKDLQPNTSYSKATVATRVGARIYLTIPGEVTENVKVTDFKYNQPINDKAFFKFKIVNDGNVVYEPYATIEIADNNGRTFDRIEKSLGTIGPHTAAEPIVTWEKRPIIGSFTANAQVAFKKTFESASQVHAAALVELSSIKFTIIPWTGMLHTTLFIIIVLLALFYWKKRRQLLLAKSEKYTVQENEDLIMIAAGHNYSWKKIARLNKLKPPYIIKKGEVILIPPHENLPHEKK